MEDFDPIEIESEHCELSLEWIGEGRDGDYDKSDRTDEPRLRFTVKHKTLLDWEGVEPKQESYCTGLDARLV